MTQDIDIASVRAQEEFRWGVKALQSGFFSDSILAFEQSLFFAPNDPQTLEWLGWSYYRSGFEDTALGIWQDLRDAGEASAYVQNVMETVAFRRGMSRELVEKDRYVIAHELEGEQRDYALFMRPTSIVARADGSFYLASFAGNEVILFSANGAVKRRFLGGLQGLDHPFDVIETEMGQVFISEFSRDAIYRSDTSGVNAKRLGESGVAKGQLSGPQYLAADGIGYLYVTEAGNRRVSKFDYDGNFVLTFGQPDGGFSGLKSPTGIAVVGDFVYVADSRGRYIGVFDRSGNYVSAIASGELVGPEGLSATEDGALLVADGARVLRIDLGTETVTPVSDLGGDAVRVSKAVEDANGNVLVADLTRNTVTWLNEISALYTGLFPQVGSIVSGDHPRMTMEVAVQDRDGVPLVGLDHSNFIVTEHRLPVQGLEFLTTEDDERAAVALLVEKSPATAGHRQAIRDSLAGLYTGFGSRGDFQLFSAGETASKETDRGVGLDEIATLAEDGMGRSDAWRFDLGLRLAASSLVGAVGSRAVVFVSSGHLNDGAFRDYSLDVLARHLANNGIRFYCMYLTDERRPAGELAYLCEETGGMTLYVYQAAGVGPLVDAILSAPTGRYYFSYDSRSRTDFGEAFIPVEVQAFLFKRSGRAESGYFAPLEF